MRGPCFMCGVNMAPLQGRKRKKHRYSLGNKKKKKVPELGRTRRKEKKPLQPSELTTEKGRAARALHWQCPGLNRGTMLSQGGPWLSAALPVALCKVRSAQRVLHW